MSARRTALAVTEYRVIQSIPHRGSGHLELVDSAIFGRRAVRKYIDLFGLEDAVPLQEPRLLDEIKHPRIVRVQGARFDRLHGTRVVVFDMPFYQEGSVLRAFEEGHRFSTVEAIRITNDVLDALQYVHGHLGYVHRDIKPDNVLLDQGRRRALLSDFGSAARLENGSVRALGGSQVYRAPEYRSGCLDVRADVYALGLMLHETLSGALPYAEMDPVLLDERQARGLRGPTDAQLEDAPQVPPALRRIVHRATHRRADHRYSSAGAFRTALTRVRLIDWRRLPARWEGADSGSPRSYRVMEERARGGRTRLVALRRANVQAGWRRFGVLDRIVSTGDRGDYRAFFDEVDSVARSR